MVGASIGMMLTPYIHPIAAFAIGTLFYRMFQWDCFAAWREQKIVEIVEIL